MVFLYIHGILTLVPSLFPETFLSDIFPQRRYVPNPELKFSIHPRQCRRNVRVQEEDRKDVRSHSLLAQLQTCNFSYVILILLQERIFVFDHSRSTSGTIGWLANWPNPTVNVLHTFSESAVIGGVISLVRIRRFEVNPVPDLTFVVVQVYPPTEVIFTGIGILLSVSILRSLCDKQLLLRRPCRFLLPISRGRLLAVLGPWKPFPDDSATMAQPCLGVLL